MKAKKHSSTPLVALFILVQLALVFFSIHHQNTLTRISFQKQDYEKKKLELAQRKTNLKHALHSSHDLARIKEFALQATMQKVTLDQIKAVPDECPTA